MVRGLRPLAEALPHWPRVDLTPEEARRIRNGQTVPCRSEDRRALLMEAGCELALAERREQPQGPCWAILRGLWN